jgi:hypothetical protein
MKNFPFKRVSALVLVIAAVSCASPPQRESYAIDARVSQNGVVLGEPSVLVEPGTTATVSVNGAGGYDLELSVRPSVSDSDQALVEAELRTLGESVTSQVVVELGEPATISVDDVDLVLLVREANRDSRSSVNSTSSRF